MARPIRTALKITGWVVAAAAAAIAGRVIVQLHEDQEYLMAQFDGLDTDIAALRSAIADAAGRVERAVDALIAADAADQTQVDEARAEVTAAIDSLKAIAPEPAAGGPVPNGEGPSA